MTTKTVNQVFVLFRGSERQIPDEYCDLLNSFGIVAKTVPPLSLTLVNQEKLTTELITFNDCYSGLIVTSAHVCQVIRNLIVGHLKDHHQNDVDRIIQTIPVLPVGPKTAQNARELGFRFLLPMKDGEVKNSDELAAFVGRCIDSNADLGARLQQRPLLWATSDIAKGNIVQLLARKSVQVAKFICYETSASADLNVELGKELAVHFEPLSRICDSQLNQTIQKLLDQHEIQLYFVMFSPSGVDSVLKHVSCVTLSKVRWIAIGPTTGEYLNQLGLIVDKVAKHPSPNGILNCVKEIIPQ